MKYEDLKRVREERAATAKAAVDKANDNAREADTSVPAVKDKRAKRTSVQGRWPAPELRPWRALVAPMYPGAA
jgi:hypothetical protein